MASNAEHRLRIVEEDRDLLAQQAVALQRMLDKERRDRQAAQGAQQQAQQALRELVKGDAAKVKAEHERLVELHAQAAHLRTRVETAARSGKGAAPGLLEVLQERAERAEAAAGGQREQRQRVEQEAVRRLALSLKVLQLQKESADRAVLAKQRAQAHNDAARDEAARLREEEQRKDDAPGGVVRGGGQNDAAAAPDPGGHGRVRAGHAASGKQPAPTGRRVPAPGKAAPRRGVARR